MVGHDLPLWQVAQDSQGIVPSTPRPDNAFRHPAAPGSVFRRRDDGSGQGLRWLNTTKDE